MAMRLRSGSVFGYLIAGVMIGPFLALVGADIQGVQHIAEFGIVMLLFIIGLDLEQCTLWETRYHLVGLGGAQIAVTTLVFTELAMAFGQPLDHLSHCPRPTPKAQGIHLAEPA